MKQASLFSWLQRSPENQQKKLFSNDVPSSGPVTSTEKTLSHKKTPMKCAENISPTTASAALTSPTVKKSAKSKENKEKKPKATCLPASPFAIKSPCIKENKSANKIAPSKPKSVKEKAQVIVPDSEAMAVDSPVNLVSSDSEDAFDTHSGKEPLVAKDLIVPTETKVLSSDSESEKEDIKQPIKGPFKSWWNKPGKSIPEKLATSDDNNTDTCEPAKVAPLPVPPQPPVIEVPMPPVREIICPENVDAGRIPDVLVVTEFLLKFGCLILKKGSRKSLDPEPDFHILLKALGRPDSEDPLYLCGLIFHLMSFISKQPSFAKVKHLGQPLSEFDLSVQSGPEILRLFLNSLSPKSLVPALTNEFAEKWLEKGFFALMPNERLDILLMTVNWLISTPIIIDYMTKKEEALQKLRSKLFLLRKKQNKEKASAKLAQATENAENIEEMFNNQEGEEDSEEEKPRAGPTRSQQKSVVTSAASLTELASEITEVKQLVDKAEREYNEVRCHLPIGVDRDGATYWQFQTFSITSADRAVVIENKNTWSYYSVEDLFKVISSMQSNPFAGDFNLRFALESIVKDIQSNQQEGIDEQGFLEEDVDFSAGILDEVTDNLLDSEARIYAAAFADPLPDVDDWRSRVKSPLPEDRAKSLSQCLLTLANSVHLRVLFSKVKVSPGSFENKEVEEDAEEDGDRKKKKVIEDNVLFFAEDSYFAKWKAEVAKTESASRLLLLLDLFLNWLNWSMSAEHARCRRCRRGPNSGVLILCDKCNRSYHMRCLDPPMKEAPDGDWFCPECKKKETRSLEQQDLEVVSDDDDDDDDDGDEDSESEYEVPESDEDDEPEFREPDTECKVCRGPGNDLEELISCSICYHSFHLDCLKPPLRYPPRGTWYCAKCLKTKSKRVTKRRVICDSPPSTPPRPKAKAVQKTSTSRRTTRSSNRDLPSRNSSRQTASRTSNNRSVSPPPVHELCDRYSFRPRGKRM